MLVNDIRVDNVYKVGVDILFALAGYDPINNDYYSISDGVATLHHGVGPSIPLTDSDGNILHDSDGNILYSLT